LLLSLLLHCTGSLSQPVLTQLPSASASLGDSANIKCRGKFYSVTRNNHLSWYIENPGGERKSFQEQTRNKGDGIPDRFSGSSSGADRYLTISNVHSEDEADYYCGSGDSS
uniref:Ig-like domain-containing protein n=1 Tax=Otolemur garnettii TaxID=30611 RepID=H0XTE8_OTOGA